MFLSNNFIHFKYTWKNNFAESKILGKYKSENNFVIIRIIVWETQMLQKLLILATQIYPT